MYDSIVDNYLSCLENRAATDPNVVVELVKDRSERGVATYLLNAWWCDDEGTYHRKQYLSSKPDLLQSFINEHPEWEEGSPWDWGYINGHRVNLDVYLVVDSLPYRSWENRIASERERLIKKRAEEAHANDIKEYSRLKEKLGL